MLMGDTTVLLPPTPDQWKKNLRSCSWWDRLLGLFGASTACADADVYNKAYSGFMLRFPGALAFQADAYAQAASAAYRAGLPIPPLG